MLAACDGAPIGGFVIVISHLISPWIRKPASQVEFRTRTGARDRIACLETIGQNSSRLDNTTDIFNGFAAEIQDLIETGREFHRRGWSLGTSSNYSIVAGREPLRLILTGSGFDKGRLTPEQFVLVDEQGKRATNSGPRPSAESFLHVVLAQAALAGAVLHTHSVYGTMLSEAHLPAGCLEISGYEMLKGLAGVTTHEFALRVEIFANTQNIPDLARQVDARLRDTARPMRHAFLIAGHGLYTWGKDLAEARRHVEVLEFLFEVVARKKLIFPGGAS